MQDSGLTDANKASNILADVTDWFTIGLHGNPVHSGFYEVLYEFDESKRTSDFPLRYWNGDWYLDELDWVECQGGKSKSCCFGWDGDKWRGLTAPASELME